jgi:hypothetical protein
MNEHLQVGIDIGGSKMLLLGISIDRQIRAQIATGKDFAAADVQAKIDRFVRTLPTPPRSASRFRD